RHLHTEFDGRVSVARMHSGGVSHSAELQDLAASFRGGLCSIDDKKSERRRKFFDRPRMTAADTGTIRKQASCSRRNRNAGEIRDEFGGFSDDSRIKRSLRRHQNLCDGVRFGRIQEMPAFSLKLRTNLGL